MTLPQSPSSRAFNIQRERLTKALATLKHDIDMLEPEFNRQVVMLRQNFEDRMGALELASQERKRKLVSHFEKIEPIVEAVSTEAEEFLRKERRAITREMKRMSDEMDKLKASLAAAPVVVPNEIEISEVKKAATLAIYDSIIFAIGNWSTEGDTAPDFELACQSMLFPVIYERVMRGEEDYYLEKVPPAAPIVVQRGREYVKHFREVCTSSLVDPNAWDAHAREIQQWWIRDALPLIYGARADEWDEDIGLSLTEILEWRDQPASRALHFPLIFDGMEMISKYRDQIRDTTGLPEFNKTSLETRLNP